jgi:hypothetical protein
MSLPNLIWRDVDYTSECLKKYDCYTRERILGGRDQEAQWLRETCRREREDQRYMRAGNTVVHRMQLPGGCTLFKLMCPRLINRWGQ